MPSNHLILCHPLLLLPSIFLSIRDFSNESALLIRGPKYWSFSFNISPFNEYPGLISFRMDWLNLFAVQGTLKSLLQHHSSKASILRCSAFFMVQVSHPYMTTGKIIALTRWTFVGKVMSLFFNMLSRLVIAFFLRSKHLLISWLQSPSAVILEPKKIKSVPVSIVSPSICPEVMGPDAIHDVLKIRILKWFAVPFSSGPHLSELSMTRWPSWVALQGMAHSFTELDKTVVTCVEELGAFCPEQSLTQCSVRGINTLTWDCGPLSFTFTLMPLCPENGRTLLIQFFSDWNWERTRLFSSYILPPHPQPQTLEIATYVSQVLQRNRSRKR